MSTRKLPTERRNDSVEPQVADLDLSSMEKSNMKTKKNAVLSMSNYFANFSLFHSHTKSYNFDCAVIALILSLLFLSLPSLTQLLSPRLPPRR